MTPGWPVKQDMQQMFFLLKLSSNKIKNYCFLFVLEGIISGRDSFMKMIKMSMVRMKMGRVECIMTENAVPIQYPLTLIIPGGAQLSSSVG